MRRTAVFNPFAARGRRAIVAILITFALVSALSVALSIRATSRSRLQGSVVVVAGRQRTLAERYVNDVLLVRAGTAADPETTASILRESAHALLDGGEAPAANGDDDGTKLPAATAPTVRAQLEQQIRLVNDLTATGRVILAGGTNLPPQTAGEHVATTDPVERLRILAAITSNASLNAARTMANSADQGISGLIRLQVVLGGGGLVLSMLLGAALIAATRRQTAHFRSLVQSSTDLVMVFGEDGCRYMSDSVLATLGLAEAQVLGKGYVGLVHPDDLTLVEAAATHGEPHELVFRMRNGFGEWRHLEAYASDLRGDRYVRGVVLNARDVSERVRLEEELTRQAFHDSLTDLANRALFLDRLKQTLARAARSGTTTAVVLADLDGFKQINDTLGHDAGDRLLVHVGQRFTSATRDGDTLARLGGDEFAVVLEDASEAEALVVSRRMLARLSEPIDVAGRELVIGASVGIATQAGGGDEGQLLRHADVAMYAAKEAGRGRCEVFQEDMARDLGEQLGLDHEMRLGLDRGEFSVHYQPEIDLATKRTVGVEALLRWNSPTRGAVPPSKFIAVAESTGLIVTVGEFVLRQACLQAAAWWADGLIDESFVTWVNLSGRQLSGGGVDELVDRVLVATGLPPAMLGLEVTETAIVAEGHASERARRELEALHDRGVRIAIDDFGTGVSSLGQLRRFPVDLIKVDKSFVQGVARDQKDAAIATNVVNLAHALGLPAIAEGIETDSQLESMVEFGCDLAQGYLFARPAPPEEVASMLGVLPRALPVE